MTGGMIIVRILQREYLTNLQKESAMIKYWEGVSVQSFYGGVGNPVSWKLNFKNSHST